MFSAARTLKFGRQAGADDDDDYYDGASGYDSYWKNLASGGRDQQEDYGEDYDEEEEDDEEEEEEEEEKEKESSSIFTVIYRFWLFPFFTLRGGRAQISYFSSFLLLFTFSKSRKNKIINYSCKQRWSGPLTLACFGIRLIFLLYFCVS